MNRLVTRISIGAGVAATLGGILIAFSGIDLIGAAVDSVWVLRLLGLGCILGAIYFLYAATRTSNDPVPWSDSGPIVDTRPEAAPSTYPLSGWKFARTVSEAAETARKRRQTDPGVDIVREPLRDVYIDAMVAGGGNREAAERDLETGSWTDDVVAAAVLSPEVAFPSRRLRQRVMDWLFPDRAVRRVTLRAVAAVAETTADRIPPVVGQNAPRNIPIYRPSLATLRQGPDGTVQTPPQPQEEPESDPEPPAEVAK